MTAPLRSPTIISLAALTVAMVSIQVGAALAKTLFPIVGPEGVAALRLCFASLMMMVIWRPWRNPLRDGNRRYIVGYGVSLGLMNILFYCALNRIPLGVTVALEFTGPLLLAVLASRRRIDFLWIGLAIIGLYLLLNVESTELTGLGIIFALGAGFFWAMYIVFGQKAGVGDSGQTVAYGALIGALVVLPLGIHHAGIAWLSPAVIPSAIALALMASAIPYSLEMVALTRMPTKTFGILMSAEPVFAAISGFAFLKERLDGMQILGIAMIVIASGGTIATHGANTGVTLDA